MYTDRNSLDEYAYHGVFYRSEQKPEEDGDLIGSDGDMLGDTDSLALVSVSPNISPSIPIRSPSSTARNKNRKKMETLSEAMGIC